MASIDVVLLLVLLMFLADGLWRGLTREMASFLGLVAGLIVATMLYRPLGRMLGGLAPTPGVALPLAWVALMLGCWIVANLIGLAARRRARDRDESWDRLGGGLLGLLGGVIILGVALNLGLALRMPFARQAQSAPLGSLLLRLFARLGRLVS